MYAVKYSFLIVAIILLGCNRQLKFDKVKWLTKDDMEYLYRDKMLEDLITNYKLKGIKYIEVVKSLGQPQFSDNTSLSYEVIVHYNGIDPDYTKSFELLFNRDSIITEYKVNEWKKK